jgi:chorismate mutase
MLRAIRGAITVESNTREAILRGTEELLLAMVTRNVLHKDDMVNVIFTVTPDLDAEFPAAAARRLGWALVPLLCAREIPVPGALPFVVRVLIQAYTTRSQAEVKHVYLKDAVKLRDDIEG